MSFSQYGKHILECTIIKITINFIMTLKDWEEDIAELKVVLETVKRTENVKFIQQQIKLLQTRIDKAKVEQPVKIEIKPEVKPEVKKEPTTQIVVDNLITIVKYSYDQ